ncbi:MAG: hypothetical protein H6Q90_1550 [Deltaproteobacteria bacterium]|nr:hypothetical protein [Deltaproteobacteria bacterium]
MMRTMMVTVMALGLGLIACDKPSEDDCRKAIENMRTLIGTENTHTDLPGEIRRCQGGSKKQTIRCAMNAKTRAELEACHVVDPIAPASGSGAGSGSGK